MAAPCIAVAILVTAVRPTRRCIGADARAIGTDKVACVCRTNVPVVAVCIGCTAVVDRGVDAHIVEARVRGA